MWFKLSFVDMESMPTNEKMGMAVWKRYSTINKTSESHVLRMSKEATQEEYLRYTHTDYEK